MSGSAPSSFFYKSIFSQSGSHILHMLYGQHIDRKIYLRIPATVQDCFQHPFYSDFFLLMLLYQRRLCTCHAGCSSTDGNI